MYLFPRTILPLTTHGRFIQNDGLIAETNDWLDAMRKYARGRFGSFATCVRESADDGRNILTEVQ